jgi:hypothetical protein
METKMEDSELSAMQSVLAALQPLDEQARVRVLRWGWERFGESDVAITALSGPRGAVATERSETFADAAEVVERAGASNGPERALCVGYFLQEMNGQAGFSGQEINSALKNLGHPLSNVTKTLSDLRAQKPALVLQVSKAGRAQQARKTYRLTVAGLDRVRQMLRASENGSGA